MKLDFATQFKVLGIPLPYKEYQFALKAVPKRKFAFDFAWPEDWIALEKEGGLYGMGPKCKLCGRRRPAGHSSIDRLKRDMEKYNLAAQLGWKVLRCFPYQIENGEAVEIVRAAMMPQIEDCQKVLPF